MLSYAGANNRSEGRDPPPAEFAIWWRRGVELFLGDHVRPTRPLRVHRARQRIHPLLRS